MDLESLVPLGGSAGLLVFMVRIWWREQARREREQAAADARHQAELAGIDERRAVERADYERQIASLKAQLNSEGRGGA